MIQNTHPTPSLIWGCMLWEKRRVRSLGFLVTVLPLACWGTTEKLLGLFGLSFLLCKVRGVGTWSQLYQTSPLGSRDAMSTYPCLRLCPQVLRRQPRTQENPYLQKASISVLNVAPCPCLWRAHPSFLKQFSLHSLHFFTLQLFSNSCKPCSCFNHSQERTLTNASNYLMFTTSNHFYLVFILPVLYVEGNTFMIFFFYQQSSTAHILLKMTTSSSEYIVNPHNLKFPYLWIHLL